MRPILNRLLNMRYMWKCKLKVVLPMGVSNELICLLLNIDFKIIFKEMNHRFQKLVSGTLLLWESSLTG